MFSNGIFFNRCIMRMHLRYDIDKNYSWDWDKSISIIEQYNLINTLSQEYIKKQILWQP